MAPTQASRRKVFRTIAAAPYSRWPVYDTTPLYDRSSLGAIEEDIRTVARVWFDHDAHESVEHFVCCLPLSYTDFAPHDDYLGTTRYGMEQLVQVFILKELHGWEHESALVEYLYRHPMLCERLNFETIPDQSTLWQTWHQRFTLDLREMIATVAKTILIQADRAEVLVPHEPPEQSSSREQPDETAPTQRTVLNRTAEITEQVSEIAIQRSRWVEERAVRYTRMRSGICRPTSGFVKISRRMRAHAASSTSPIETEPRSGTTIEHTCESCRSAKSARCTER
jgi:hypothetical protein